MIKLTIPGPPCAKQRPKVYGKHAVTPAKTVNYETLVKQLYIVEHHRKQLEGPLIMKVVAYFPIPQSKSKKVKEAMLKGKIRPTSKPDIDNLFKIIADALNGLAYHDDSQIVQGIIDKWYSDNPRMEVFLREIGA